MKLVDYYFFLRPNQLSNFLGFQVTLEGDCYHKTCFRCAHGGCHLTHSSYAALDGNLYCKHHFAQLFMVKGNYHHVLQAAAHKKNGATPPSPPADSEPKPEPESNVQEQSSQKARTMNGSSLSIRVLQKQNKEKKKKKQKKGADPLMLLKFISNFIYKFSVSKLI